MGLLDVLNGMQNGPRGSSTPSAQSGGGMSPMTMAILALLAYKAVKHISGGSASASTLRRRRHPRPPAELAVVSVVEVSAGLVMFSRVASAACSRAARRAAIISGGLGDLLKQLQQNGHGETANSWVAPGPNKQISPGDLASALGADQINSLMSQSGLSREDLLNGLSQHLPEVVNHLTPDGRLPTQDELADRL